MVLIYVASFNRASDGAVSKLLERMKEEKMWTSNCDDADYILAVGDREETFDFILGCFRDNKKIIHLWAGEISQGTHDEVYRHSITLMSCIQLCTNQRSKGRVKDLCKSIDKESNSIVVGNVMLDNLVFNESLVPNHPYHVVLYNPPTLLSREEIIGEINSIKKLIDSCEYFWIEPNSDKYSDLVPYNTPSLPRDKYLGLLKNCNKVFTNSSSEYYEMQHLLDPLQIVHIGKRNIGRESKYSDMCILNATENIINIFKELDVGGILCE